MTTHTQFRPEQIDASVFVAQGAVVVGDVTIGPNSSVWFNAVLRGDSEAIHIGERTNIQDGCVLHSDPGFVCRVGSGVTIGHGAIVHGATIGDNVTIGMGAILLNGAEIGVNSLVGAGALVTEGTQVPPGSLVLGMPGKVVRPLGEDEIERNRTSAVHYVDAARAYASAKVLPGA